MAQVARGRDRKLIAWILAIGFFQQVTVLPVLHVLHWAKGSGVARPATVLAASGSVQSGISLRREANRPARHDANACPTCAALAQHRGGLMAPPAVWHTAQDLSLPVTAATGTPARSAERLVAAPRAPPLLLA